MISKITKICIATVSVCAVFCSFGALGQSNGYKPGDRVEALWNGKWEAGTVMPLSRFDLDKTGRVLRIKLDCLADVVQPEGTEILAKDVRARGTQPLPAGNSAGNGPSIAPGTSTTSGANFKPGDRVEATWSGKRVTGVVMPLSRLDLDKSGRVLRIKIDGMADFLQPEGTEILAKDVQHSSSPPTPNRVENQSPPTKGNGQPAPNAVSASPSGSLAPKRNTDYKTPVMTGSVPNLIGTAWKMLYDRPANVVPLIRFTRKGTYDTVRYGLGAGMQGTYRQNGSTLFLNNESYSLTFDATTNILLVRGKNETLKLLYNGITSD